MRLNRNKKGLIIVEAFPLIFEGSVYSRAFLDARNAEENVNKETKSPPGPSRS